MAEKIYCVDNFWDMTITDGVAGYNDKKYYFNCVFSEDIDDWTDIYELTLLDDYIFRLTSENWEYWKSWLNKFSKNYPFEIPHPSEYANIRAASTVDEIFNGSLLRAFTRGHPECEQKALFNGKNIEKDIIELTEKYYQNDIIIKEYLKNNKPICKVKGTFSGDINGMDTKVEWENVI
jgi:hypothetical protein